MRNLKRLWRAFAELIDALVESALVWAIERLMVRLAARRKVLMPSEPSVLGEERIAAAVKEMGR